MASGSSSIAAPRSSKWPPDAKSTQLNMFLSKPPPLSDTITFEIYYGVSSPWALLGLPEARRIAEQYGLTIHLKPILVITENGGILLASRTDARLAYHALDLWRYAEHYGVPMKLPKPKYYPQKPGGIELAAQAIIRLQQHYGVGSKEALDYSYEVQRCIWVTEEGDHCEVETLRNIGRRLGFPDEVIQSCIVDKRGDKSDAGVAEWDQFHKEAVQKGMFGTPNYVINDEIFWGQDRLFMLENRVKQLVAHGAKPVVYK